MFDTKSTFFENIHTHRFLADVLTYCALRKPSLFIDVLRGEVDDGGIDLVLLAGAESRFIQLKARAETVEPKPYHISKRLLSVPGGAVVWIRYRKDNLSTIDYYALMLGLNESISEAHDFKPAFNRKGNPREGYSLVPMAKANHKKLSLAALCDLLFPNEGESHCA